MSGAAGDFDGDGRGDPLPRHLHSDAWRYYTLVEDVPAEHALETEPVWRFVASGDIDGNGYDDVLTRRYDTIESAYHAVTEDRVEVRVIRITVNPLSASDKPEPKIGVLFSIETKCHGRGRQDGSSLAAAWGLKMSEHSTFDEKQ